MPSARAIRPDIAVRFIGVAAGIMIYGIGGRSPD
jgi:hypothetical protein